MPCDAVALCLWSHYGTLCYVATCDHVIVVTADFQAYIEDGTVSQIV